MNFQHSGNWYTYHFTFEEVAAEADRVEIFLQPKPKQSVAGVVSLKERDLTGEQKRTVADVLRNSEWQPKCVWIRCATGCEECRRYALSIKDALTLAGWPEDFGRGLDEREDLLGLKLNVRDVNAKPQTASLVALALERASINFEWFPLPEMQEDTTIIWVYRQTN